MADVDPDTFECLFRAHGNWIFSATNSGGSAMEHAAVTIGGINYVCTLAAGASAPLTTTTLADAATP